MKAVSVVFLGVFIAAVTAAPVSAQIPNVQIFFDEGLQVTDRNCPTELFVLDTLYIVASNFNAQIIDIEYKIRDNVYIAFIADIVDPSHSVVGTSGTGILISFSSPQDATAVLLVQGMFILWNCTGCPAGFPHLWVDPHPSSGKVQATSWPNMTKIEGVGKASGLCGLLVPVEPSTWGRVKSLYQ